MFFHLKNNEYCVYRTEAQCIRYIIEYTTAADRAKGVVIPPALPIFFEDSEAETGDERLKPEPVKGKSRAGIYAF